RRLGAGLLSAQETIPFNNFASPVLTEEAALGAGAVRRMHMPASRGRTPVGAPLPLAQEGKAARGGGSSRPSSGGHQVGAIPPSPRAGRAASRAGRSAYSRLCGPPAQGPGEDEEEEAESGQVNPRGSCLPGRCCWKPPGLSTPGLRQGPSPLRPPPAPDDINPRTGLVVALVSVFLVFGFMFTVSGIKGETLGDIPLLAIGPAICLPGIAAIALTRKTDGCTKCPENMRPCCKEVKDRDVLELLRTPSDLESGKGSCDELARKAYRKDRSGLRGEDTVFICTTSTTAAATAEGKSLTKKVEQEEMLKYLESCYPEMPENVFVGDGSTFSALEKKSTSPSRDSTPCPDIEDNIFVAPKDSIIVCSYKDNSPYDRYCCYINPTGVNSDQET
ncbi:hypothetical protein EK904_006485, partial [Melospiza melodia maxima]